MKLGKDFWFWVKLIYIILKAILEDLGSSPNPKLTAGHRAFNATLAELVGENEDDARKPEALDSLKGK